MKIVTHNVLQGSIVVNGKEIASIKRGLACFIGFKNEDTLEAIKKTLDSLLTLRIFPDQDGKTNLSIVDIQGDLLLIPNFTLYGDTTSRRPSFTHVMPFDQALALFEASSQYLQLKYSKIQTGQFGADMTITLNHDGPFTLTL
jgi:D-aminoacyl-tRNA deacylase